MKFSHAAFVLPAALLSASCGSAGLDSDPANMSTAAVVWTTPARIDTAEARDSEPVLSVSPSGRTIAMWTRSVGGERGGFDEPDGRRSSRFTPGGGWSATEAIRGFDPRDRPDSIAIDDDGNAIVSGSAVASEPSLARDGPRVWWSQSRDGSPWTPPEFLPWSGDATFETAVVFLASGAPVVSWVEGAGGLSRTLWACVGLGGGEWSPAHRVADRVADFSLVAGDDGRALLLWNRVVPDVVLASVYDRETGWADPERVSAPSTGAGPPRGAFVGGQAYALWSGFDGIALSVRSGDGRWTEPAPGPQGERPADEARLAVDGSGNVLAVWRESRSGTAWLYGAFYDRSAGWKPARLLTEVSPYTSETHDLVLDPLGRGLALWSWGGSVCAQAHEPQSGWETAPQCFGGGTEIHAAVGGNGRVMAIWPQDGAIWFSTSRPRER